MHLLIVERIDLSLAPLAMLLQGSGWSPFVPILLMIGIFFLLVIWPARKRQKKLDAMLADLVSGDRVVTNGGWSARSSAWLRVASRCGSLPKASSSSSHATRWWAWRRSPASSGGSNGLSK